MTIHQDVRQLLLAAIMTIGLIGPVLTASAQDATEEAGGASELAPQLPAVDLPTMNEMGYRFELESQWTGNADSVPQDLPIFGFEPIDYTEEEVARIAETLGVEGEITSQGESTFTVQGNGSIYTTPGLLQFVSAVEPSGEELPEDDAAIAFAREWLRVSGLLPANIGEGRVVARIEQPARLIVGFVPTNPSPLLTTSPGITVTVGPEGTILEARVSWATVSEAETFRLRAVQDAFSMVQSRRSYLDVTLPSEQFPQGSTISGTAVYDRVSIAYTTSGTPDAGQFMQPVYAFTGTLQPEGSGESFPISAYVPAIVTGQQPVG